MARKIVGVFDPGDSSHVGTTDFDYINQYLTGSDQSTSDPVTINTSTTFGSGKLVATSPVFSAPSFSTITNAGATLTLPTTTQTLVGRTTTDTLTNKTMDYNANTFQNFPGATGASTTVPNTWSAIQTFNDGNLALRNPLNTFSATVKAGAQTAAQTFTFPVTASDTIATIAAAQTLTNKTLTSPTIGSIINTGTLTLPSSTDTLIGRATTDTLTNKTMNYLSNTFLNFPSATGLALPSAGTQYGWAVWGGNAPSINATGRLDGITTKGTAQTVVNNATAGQYIPMGTGTVSGTAAGLIGPTTLTSRQWNPVLTVKASVSTTTSNILWIGFSSNLTAPTSNTPLGGTDNGILVGWRSSDTTVQVVTNAASTETFTAYTPTTSQGTGFFTFQITGDNTNSRWQVSVNGQTIQNFITNIPAATTMLTPVIVTINNTTVNQLINIPWVQLQETF